MVIGAILIFIAPLLHRAFSKTNPKIDAYEEKLTIKVTDIDKKLATNLCDFENNLIRKDNYLLNLHQLKNRRTQILEQNKNDLKKFKTDNRFLGWKTVRAFWVGFGVRLPYLLLSIIVSFLVYKINTQEKSLKRAFFWLQVSCYAISFYFMFWVFWTSQDFSIIVYRWLFVLFSIIASITTVSFIHYIDAFRLKSSLIIEKLIVLHFTNDKYIDTEKNSRRHLEKTIKDIDKIIS